MKLYTFDPAPNPKRVTLFLKYKDIEIDTTQIDMGSGEQLGDDYKRINPLGTLPALVLDDGTVLTEVIGICSYLESQFPDKPLMGSTALEQAQVLSWDHKLFNTVMMAVAEALRNHSPAFANRALPGPLDVPQISELVQRGKLRLEHAWPSIEADLEGRNWLAGDSISLADIDFLVCCEFSGWVKCAPPESCKNIHAHIARVRQALSLD
ncbi:MAG: glutathione S-transferase family protein [Halieaceae bacterium]|jgi:glutathione S-transferase|nr:glutathione S-transferase family protein [Halieaceae bacterium]